MKYQIKTNKDAITNSDYLIVGLTENDQRSETYKKINQLSDQALDWLYKSNTFSAASAEFKLLTISTKSKPYSILLVGLGKSTELDHERLHGILKKVAHKTSQEKMTQLAINMNAAVNKTVDNEIIGRAITEAFTDQEYRYEQLPKPAKKPAKTIPFNISILTQGRAEANQIRKGAKVGHAIANGKSLTKDLANLPGNVCTPTYLASQAKKLAKSHGVKTKILSEKDMTELGMGSLLSVSKGSREPAKLIIMEYKGAKNIKQAPHVLVGKGLTFDAGGISIKPSAKMDEMKYDMCGGASVFGTLLAIAELELPINVIGIVPSSENLPDGKANKPGDIVTSMSGQTIEILNTDAEGRLILCDALTYAKRFKPASVVDIATLTGAVIVALGHQTAGVMGNDQGVIDDLLAAGEKSLDYAWQLPLKETYKKQLKSEFADLANIGGPTAGTITAGCFLSYFTEDFRWAHLDIAGTAWGGEVGKRASGRAVPILTQYLIDRC